MQTEKIKTWDLKINSRNEAEKERCELAFKEIKKDIGRKIFTSVGIWDKTDNGYWIAKKIYESIFAYSDDDSASFLGLDLKTKLMKGHHYCMNDIIENEYRKILEQAQEIEILKSRIDFFENIFLNLNLKPYENT